MDKIEKIKKYLREIAASNTNLPFKGTVKSVQAEECDVELEGGLLLTNVKLKPTVNESENYLILYPKVGTKVMMLSSTGEVDNLTVIQADEIEKLSYKQNGLQVLIDSTDGKVAVQNNNVSLHGCFDQLYDLLKTFKVYTPAGPSGLPLPNTMTKIESFNTKFNQVLKAV